MNLLVRSFLLRGERESPAYSFHTYLFFSDNSQSTLSTRTAASAAVLNLFNDVRTVSGLQLDESNLAVLHIPVCSRESAAAIMEAEIKQQNPVELLIGKYDYDRARLIKRQIEGATLTSLPRVALLAHPRPLSDVDSFDLSQLYVIDLEQLTAKQMEDHITWFRNALESPGSDLKNFPSMASNGTRNFFDAVGSKVNQYKREH